MTDKQSLIEFPCNFPIKIIGKNSAVFMQEICEIILRHFPHTLNKAITSHESEHGKYLSITATIYVHNQITLDALYLELTKHPDIKMVL
jgi:putative lipoic acid-binding regulatory protein